MKNLKVLFTVLCVACTTAVWGATVSQTYTLSNNDNGQNKATGDVTWAIGTGAITAQSNNMKLTGTITVTLPSGATLTSVEITKSNTWGSGATVVFASKTTTLNTFSNSGSFTLTKNKTDLVYTFTKSGTSSKNAWVKTIKVTYESGSTETTPSITQQPKDATYDQGAKAAALTITASGNPTPTYQWYSNTSNNNSNGTVISGATEASYTPSTAKAGTFYYYCVATNSQGSASSNVATITVNTVPTYTVQWKVGGQAYTKGNPTTSVASGSKVSTLPTAPADDAIGPCANTFMGWSTHNLGSETGQGAPGDLFTTIEGSPVITQDTIFYAVFATKQNGN